MYQFHFTKAGKEKVQRFIQDCKTRREELSPGPDDETNIPTEEDILCDVHTFFDKIDRTYSNCWGITDDVNSELLYLIEGTHFVSDSGYFWDLQSPFYQKFKERQHQCSKDEGDYIGNVRRGSLCFDIVDYGNRLWFDLYVGGVDTGYAYTNQLKDYQRYPYDFCRECSFYMDDDVRNVSLEDFKYRMEKRLSAHLLEVKGYFPDLMDYERGEYVDLIQKAKEELLLW